MVRVYIRKTQRASTYSKEELKHSINEIKKGTVTIHRAHKMFHIPKTTLFYHLKGIRGQKSDTQGRTTVIPREDEARLANGLRGMEKWGFGITRKELLLIVAEYVKENNLQTPFKDDMPGDEWFKNFKMRHKLSIKKPQSVEYARKKMTDPFIISEYFDLLENTLTDLSLFNKPQQIWNLDETSFCHDPSKTKIVGDRGKPSSRTVSSPGRENTTVLSAVSASGLKAPPLIVYKGKNIWDAWVPDEKSSYEGMAFAASKNGWMETDIFLNYFQKTLIPSFGLERPVLVIFDGHSTHISIPLIELAMSDDITILKLPPHTSHLLQPLDLSVFRPMKVKWDEKLVAWQRMNIGVKMPKKRFSEMVGQTWKSLNPTAIINGFKKAGIYPFNRDVIPEDKYDVDCLKRWKQQKDSKMQQSVPETTLPNTNSSCLEHPTALTNLAQPSTSQQDVVIDQQNTLRPKMSFGELLLKKVKCPGQEQHLKVKKKRVAPGSEVITSAQVLAQLQEQQKIAEEKSASKNLKNKIKSKRKPTKKLDSDTSDEEFEEVPLIDSDEDIDPESSDISNVEDNPQQETSFEVEPGKWVLVKYTMNKRLRHFVGLVLNKNDIGYEIKFLRLYKNNFNWPKIDDIDTVTVENIVKILPDPKPGRRGDTFVFACDFAGYNLI